MHISRQGKLHRIEEGMPGGAGGKVDRDRDADGCLGNN